MAAMWYYSDRGQQKGPVPFEELRELAQSGYLKPSDLIWEEGTADWVRASKVGGLFDAPSGPGDGRGGREYPRRDDRGERWDEAGPRRRDDRLGDRPGDPYDDRPPRRIGARPPEGMSSGLKVGLIVGGVALFLIIIAVVLILVLSGSGGSVQQDYNVTLGFGGMNDRTIHFQARRPVDIQIRVEQVGGVGGFGIGDGNVDVEVFPPMGISYRDFNMGRTRTFRFTPSQTGNHRIHLRHRGGQMVQVFINVRQ